MTTANSIGEVRGNAYMQAQKIATKRAELLAGVPVGTIPDDLRPHWIADDKTEQRDLFRWEDQNRGVTDEQRQVWLHQYRVVRADAARDKAERKQEHETAQLLASRCQSCSQPVLSTDLVDRELVMYIPRAGQHIEVPGYGRLAACGPCRVVLPVVAAELLSSELVHGRPRAEVAAETLRLRAGQGRSGR